MNTGAIDKIYNYLPGEKDYTNIPETERARKTIGDEKKIVKDTMVQRSIYQIFWYLEVREIEKKPVFCAI